MVEDTLGSTSRLRIVLLSALVLFLEMLLIRWIGTELRVFAYLQNAVLVAAFLGLGLGSRNARLPARLLPAVLGLLAIGFAIRDPLGFQIGEGVTLGLTTFEGATVWMGEVGSSSLPTHLHTALVVFALLVTFVLLAAVAAVFRPLGQWLGRWMDGDPRPIAAYTANLLGSVLGIGAFTMLTALRTPPWLWLIVAGLGLATLARGSQERRPARALALGGALALPLLGVSPVGTETIWSPYQKLMLSPLTVKLPQGKSATCGELLTVNNVGHQLLLDTDLAHMAARPDLYPPEEIEYSHYMLPYRLVGRPDDVLIVGSGSGNDVAAALRAGAQRVKAVEIDPAILDLGRDRHKAMPYRSPRVSAELDDARAFFLRDKGVYDLIWFGLLDSHTTPSAYTNVRLDHFVYTRESLEQVKRLLKPNGRIVLLFAPETDWIAQRLVRLLRDAFGEPPLALAVQSSTPCLGWGGLMLIAGRPGAMVEVRAKVAAEPAVQARRVPIEDMSLKIVPTTDDWPFLYLRSPHIPTYHLVVGAITLLFGVLLRQRLFRPGEDLNLTMLLLGAGFMLLETAGVSRAALLFGTTWTVNAYVVGSILGLALLANLVAERVRYEPTGWPFGGLVVSLLLLAMVPISTLTGLPLGLRILAGGGFLTLPVFFSGLVFVAVWARSERRDLAFGSNLLGALVGGVASMLTMLTGFQALTLLTLAVYMGAYLAMRRPASA